jgi:hypothetical protein
MVSFLCFFFLQYKHLSVGEMHLISVPLDGIRLHLLASKKLDIYPLIALNQPQKVNMMSNKLD